MGPEHRLQMLGMVLLIVLIGIVGVALVMALLVAWRNFNQRDSLIDQGRRMRASHHPGAEPPPFTDAWHEAGRRFTGHESPEPDEADDAPDAEADDRST